jgi:hypothetical protein
MARPDEPSSEGSEGMQLLRPGDTALVHELPTVLGEAPSEGMARRASALLAGLPEDEYAWVELPMGAVIEANGEVDDGDIVHYFLNFPRKLLSMLL